MFKSFPNMTGRQQRKDENIKNFDGYLESIKQDFLTLRKLIKDYKLDATKSLPSQIEKYLGRRLTADEKATIEFASKSIKVGGYGSYISHKKKKKKK